MNKKQWCVKDKYKKNKLCFSEFKNLFTVIFEKLNCFDIINAEVICKKINNWLNEDSFYYAYEKVNIKVITKCAVNIHK